MLRSDLYDYNVAYIAVKKRILLLAPVMIA